MEKNPKLTILFEKMRGRVFELNKDQMSVGRKEDMDICIKDGSLSSYHCDFIKTESGSYILRDHDSTNGSRVNNEPITERELQNSDIIQLGAIEMLYDCEDSNVTATNSRTHTIDLDNAKFNLSTTKELKNFSPFAHEKIKKQKKQHQLMLVIISICVLAVVGLLGWVGYTMFM